MAFGSVQTIVVCIPVAEPTTAQQQAVCPVVEGQYQSPANMQAYVIEPNQKNNIEASLGPFDYGHATLIWSAAFTMVVGLYFVSAGIGAVLGVIRGGR